MNGTRRLAISATCAAIATICIAASIFLPLRFTPLMAAALCFFIALCSSLVYGIISIITSLLISFFALGGINLSFIFAALIFAPYSVLALFIKKYDYSSSKSILIRIISVETVFNILFAAVFLFFKKVLLEYVFLGFTFGESIGLAEYFFIALIATAFMLCFDYTFVIFAKAINKNIKFLESKDV